MFTKAYKCNSHARVAGCNARGVQSASRFSVLEVADPFAVDWALGRVWAGAGFRFARAMLWWFASVNGETEFYVSRQWSSRNVTSSGVDLDVRNRMIDANAVLT
jgi:hypothetical protein